MSRRRFLLGGSVLAGSVAGASSLFDLGSEHLSVYYSGDRLVATLEHLVWTISVDQFAEGARLNLENNRGTYTVKLANACLPGTRLAVDFTARLERRLGRWYLSGSFDNLNLRFDVHLGEWLSGLVHVTGSVQGRLSSLVETTGFSVARSAGDAQLTVSPRLGVRFATADTFDLSVHGVAISARAIGLASVPLGELKALALRPGVLGHVGTRIGLEDARAAGDRIDIGRADDGALAAFESVDLAAVRLEAVETRRGLTSILVAKGSGALCVNEPRSQVQRLGGLGCDSFMLVAQTLRRKEAVAVVAAVSDEPQLVRAGQGAFIVTGRPEALVRIDSVGGEISHWSVEAQAESLSLPVHDVDIATVSFSQTSVEFRLEQLNSDAPASNGGVVSSGPFLDGEARVIPAAAYADIPSKPHPQPAGPTFPFPSEEPRIVVGLNAEGGIHAPLQKASLRVLRARDLLDLSFGFRDLKLVAESNKDPLLVPLLDGPAYDDPEIQRPLLIVNFPPQNLAQRAFLRQLNKPTQPAISCGAGSAPLRYTVEIDIDDVVKQGTETFDEAVERTRGERDAIYDAIYKHFKAKDAGTPGKLKWYNGGEGVTDAELTEAANVLRDLITARDAFPLDRAVEARLSGPSRLVFEFPPDDKPKATKEGAPPAPAKTNREIKFSIAGLTNWRKLRLVVVKRATRPKLTLDAQLKYLGFRQTRDWRERMNDVVRSIVPPSETETAIEAQIRLQLSPDEYAVWETPQQMPARGQPVPVWRSRLSQESRSSMRAIWSPDLHDGVFNCHGEPPDYGDEVPWPVSEESKKADPHATLLRLPLSVRDRHELVILSSVYGLPALAPMDPTAKREKEDRSSVVATPEEWLLYERLMTGELAKIKDQGIYDPQPLKRAIMALTSQGAHFRGEGAWEPPASVVLENTDSIWPALSVERWNHLTFLGSDIEVEVAYKGYLCPLGARSTLVKRTETRYYCHPRWHAPICYSIQRLFCEVEKEPKTYPAIGQPDLGRDWAPKAVQFVTTRTPDLVDPFDKTGAQEIGNPKTKVYSGGRIELELAGRGLAFFPRVHACLGNEFKFVFKVPNEHGDITVPLIFIDNTGAHDREFVEKLAAFYRSLGGEIDKLDADIQLRVARHTGDRRRYAEVKRDGDTDFESNWWLLNLRGRPKGVTTGETWYMDGVLEGADQPPFYPAIERAGIKIQSLDRLLGRVVPEIQVAYDLWYIRNGFDSAKNPAEIYLNLLSPEVHLDVSRDGQKTGGLAKPNSRIVSLSRVTGPVGGGAAAAPSQARSVALFSRSSADEQIPVPQETAAARNNTFSGSEVFGGALKKAKLLGLISLEDIVKVAKYTNAAPKLVERFEYGVREVEDTIRKTLVAVAPAIAEEIQNLTDAADEALQAAFGEPSATHPFRRWYPDLGDALERLRALLTQDLDKAPIFQRVTEVVEAGKVVLAEFDRVRRNPVPTVLADFVAEIQKQVDRIRNLARGLLQEELEQFLTRLTGGFNDQVKDLCGDLLKPLTGRLLGADFIKACADIDVTKPETFETLFHRLEDALYRETVGRALLEATLAVGEVQQAARSEVAKLPEKVVHVAEKALDAVIEIDRVAAFVRGLSAGEISQLCTKTIGLALDLSSNIIDLGETGTTSLLSLSKRLEQLNAKVLELPKGIVTPEVAQAIDAVRAQLAQALQRVGAICIEVQKQRTALKKAASACKDFSTIANPVQLIMRLRWQAIEHVRDIVKQLAETVDLTLASAWPPSARLTALAPPERQKLQLRVDDDKQTLRLRLVGLLELVTPIFRDLTSVAGVVTRQPFDLANVKSRVETIKSSYTPSYLADINSQAGAVITQAKALETRGAGIGTDLVDIRQKLTIDPTDAAALTKLRAVGGNTIELFKEAGLYSAELDRKLTAMALPMLAFADSSAAKIQEIQSKLEERGRAIAGIVARPLYKVHAEAANGLTAIKKLLDKPENVLLNKIVGAQLQPLLDATVINEDAEFFKTLYLKATGRKAEDDTVVLTTLPSFDEVIVAARTITDRWVQKRPALLQKADALASVVDALIHGNLSRIVDFGVLEREIREKLQQFLPTRVTLDYTFESDLNDIPSGAPIFSIDPDQRGGDGKDLTIRTEVIIDLRDMSRTFHTRGLIKPFIINIPGAEARKKAELVSLLFSAATFSAGDSSSSKFNVKVTDVMVGSILEYVQQLQAWMSPGSGPYVKPIFAPLGIEAGFRLAFPQIPIGPMQFVNIAFSIACVLPFEEEEARFRFSFCDRQRPFLIVFPPYGGGGFAGFVASAKGIVGFEAGFEFGAVIPINFGPLHANGRVTAGIYISRSGDVATIEGFVQAIGEGSIGCFTIAVCLIVGVRSKNGNMQGYSTFSVSFKVGFAEISYSFTATYTMAGSGSSTKRVEAREKRLAGGGANTCDGMPTLIVRNRAKYFSCKNFKEYKSYFDLEAA